MLVKNEKTYLVYFKLDLVIRLVSKRVKYDKASNI